MTKHPEHDHSEHNHDKHDHDDHEGHDHSEHSHEGHNHEGHDHHDHAGHDHAGHDHGEMPHSTVKVRKPNTSGIAEEGSLVSVHYTGTLDSGETFDTSIGREPIEFVIGEHNV